ncbi:hypothetical protein U879_12000 [Defluviimonas sp. 20V17]|uniref:Uncharacterized protein n=1 Tax=Allgaiera indica TaxID=765699 RepID=A0AAN4UPS6_9RHOB|nr:hypothetical protein [Allgaiera indica]KDB03451.1 hypothetical protein U879_12000 [Defluviimonas sp. 20V17]GHE00259.1 hypothetical protein GCM10008024_11050 [Allgaiera indica]SDW64758.1 hypothetical protein SAMN05444006_105207 [Allgaiera indica]
MYDAMNLQATSTSVSLLYKERPVLNFAAYVTRMEKALRGTFEDTMQLSWDHDDVVVIDIDGSRVLLGYWEATEAGDIQREGCAAAVVLSVGPGPDWRAETRLSRYRKALCKSVAAGIIERHPADLVLWKDLQGVFTIEDFDLMIDQAVDTWHGQETEAIIPGGMDDIPGAEAEIAIEAEAEAKAMAADNGDVDAETPRRGAGRFGAMPVRRLMERLETEIPDNAPMRLPDMPAPLAESADQADDTESPSALEIAARADFAKLIANDMPDLPAPDLPQLDRIRDALYPADVEEDRPELVQRLAIYTANTTLMLVALPVGAALMTYNVLGREDAKLTARAMALTGAAIGLMHSSFGLALMHLVS